MSPWATAPNTPVVINFAVLVSAFLLTLPTVAAGVKAVTKREARKDDAASISKYYEDEDGSATEEECERYSTSLPKYLALICSLVGCATSIAEIIVLELQDIAPTQFASWFAFGSWVRVWPNKLGFLDG